MRKWSLDEARRNLDSVLAAAVGDGPQVIERPVQDEVVVVDRRVWPPRYDADGTDLRDVLLARPAPEDCIDDLDDLIGDRAALVFERNVDV